MFGINKKIKQGCIGNGKATVPAIGRNGRNETHVWVRLGESGARLLGSGLPFPRLGATEGTGHIFG